jgi:DNA-binding transcriptional LysR family regulator
MLSTLSLVASGLGVSLVPASMRRLQAEGIVYRPLSPKAGLTAPLNLAHRRGDTAVALRRFIALTVEAAPR